MDREGLDTVRKAGREAAVTALQPLLTAQRPRGERPARLTDQPYVAVVVVCRNRRYKQPPEKP